MVQDGPGKRPLVPTNGSLASAMARPRGPGWSKFLLFNGLIIAIWFAVSDGGFFWPIFPLTGWGIGLFFHGMDVSRRPESEERIGREMSRLP